MPSVGKHIIHEHEEIAEKFAVILYVLGVVSIIGLYFTIKNHAKSKLVAIIALVLACYWRFYF